MTDTPRLSVDPIKWDPEYASSTVVTLVLEQVLFIYRNTKSNKWAILLHYTSMEAWCGQSSLTDNSVLR